MIRISDEVRHRVRDLRNRREWTQRELADRLGWKLSTAQNLETRMTTIDEKELARVWDVLGHTEIRTSQQYEISQPPANGETRSATAPGPQGSQPGAAPGRYLFEIEHGPTFRMYRDLLTGDPGSIREVMDGLIRMGWGSPRKEHEEKRTAEGGGGKHFKRGR